MSKIFASHKTKNKSRSFSLLAWSALPAHKYGWVQVNPNVKVPDEALKAAKAVKVKEAKAAKPKNVKPSKVEPSQFDDMSVKDLIEYIDSNGLDQELKNLPKNEIVEKLKEIN